MKRNLIFICLLIVGALPSFLGIFHPGFFSTDDGNWMVIRLSAFYEALRQGQFPVRFLPRLNNGYGYPVADFLYPLFLYLGSFIHLLHINFVTTVKVLFAISLLGSLIGSFLWLKNKFNEVSALVGALVYTLFPYHLWDITKRGSMEVLAMGIVPFIFWFIDGKKTLLTAFGIGFLILSHNTLALIFLPVIFLYMILESQIKQGLLSIILGLGFSSFFWIPALYDQQYTVFSKTIVSEYSQYFLSSNTYSLAGLIFLLVVIGSSVTLFRKVSKESIFFLVVSLVTIFLSLSISDPLWKIFHLGTYIQFPFRFLSITALGIGFLGGYIVKENKYRLILGGLILLVLYISSFKFFLPASYQYFPDTYYSTNQDTTTVQNEYMPKGVKKIYPVDIFYTVSSIESIGNAVDNGSNLHINLKLANVSQMTIGKIYFPGWSVFIDGKLAKINVNYYGLIRFNIPQGQHTVVAKFGETPVRVFADLISLFSIVILLISLLRFGNKHTR